MEETGRVVVRRNDPLLRDLELPLRSVFYPVGFPLHLETNSRDVMQSAEESFGEWSPEFDVQPVRMHVLVEQDGDLAEPPRFRMHGSLIHVVSDAHNFGVADGAALFASINVSEKTARDHAWLRWFFTESLTYLLLSQRYMAAIHAATVERQGIGIMLCGVSGAGKSTLAWACARAGFTYVADDCTWLLNHGEDRIALGRPHQIRFREDAPRHFPELEGWIARARPNGKIGIEVPTRAFPQVSTTRQCAVGRIVFLSRGAGAVHIERMLSSEAVELLMGDLPSYGDEVNAMHEETVKRLAGVPAFRLHYAALADGVRLLGEIA